MQVLDKRWCAEGDKVATLRGLQEEASRERTLKTMGWYIPLCANLEQALERSLAARTIVTELADSQLLAHLDRCHGWMLNSLSKEVIDGFPRQVFGRHNGFLTRAIR